MLSLQAAESEEGRPGWGSAGAEAWGGSQAALFEKKHAAGVSGQSDKGGKGQGWQQDPLTSALLIFGVRWTIFEMHKQACDSPVSFGYRSVAREEALWSPREGVRVWLWCDMGRAGICFGLAGGWENGGWEEEARQNPRVSGFRD